MSIMLANLLSKKLENEPNNQRLRTNYNHQSNPMIGWVKPKSIDAQSSEIPHYTILLTLG